MYLIGFLHQSTGAWLAGVACGGHFGSVNDFVWGVSGEFILSVGSDQTTRLHAIWSSADNESEVSAVLLATFNTSCWRHFEL